MIKRHKVKSCCGSMAYIFELEKPINKSFVQEFKKEGYSVPQLYIKSNILFAEKKGITGFGTFGTRRMQVKVNSKNNNKLLDDLEILLNKAQDNQ